MRPKHLSELVLGGAEVRMGRMLQLEIRRLESPKEMRLCVALGSM